MPPGSDERQLGIQMNGHTTFSSENNLRYLQLVRKYAPIISGQFFGHLHSDSFRIIYSDNGKYVTFSGFMFRGHGFSFSFDLHLWRFSFFFSVFIFCRWYCTGTAGCPGTRIIHNRILGEIRNCVRHVDICFEVVLPPAIIIIPICLLCSCVFVYKYNCR